MADRLYLSFHSSVQAFLRKGTSYQINRLLAVATDKEAKASDRLLIGLLLATHP